MMLFPEDDPVPYRTGEGAGQANGISISGSGANAENAPSIPEIASSEQQPLLEGSAASADEASIAPITTVYEASLATENLQAKNEDFTIPAEIPTLPMLPHEAASTTLQFLQQMGLEKFAPKFEDEGTVLMLLSILASILCSQGKGLL